MAIIGRIRKHAGLAVALIGIAIIGFVVQDAFGRRGQSAPPLAVINGETISYDQFSYQVDQITEQYKRAQGADVKITEEDMNQIRTIAWQRLVTDLLMSEACAINGLQVTQPEMNDMYYGKFISPYLYQYFTNPQTGQYDRQQVMNIINNFDQLNEQDKIALTELEKVIKSERLKEKYFYLLSKSYYVPSAMAALQAQAQTSTANGRVICMPFAQIDDADIKVEKSDFQKFYNENKYMFRQNKSRTLDYVVFDVNPTPQDLADLQKEVNDLFAEFVAEENIPDFVNAVTSGERFDSIYRTQSEILPGWDSLFQVPAGKYFAPRRIGKTYQMAKVMDVQMRPDSIRLQHIFLSYTEMGSQSGRNKEQSRKLADSLKDVINANPSVFGLLAAQYSEDPTAQQTRGDLGWQKEGSLIGFLNQAALSTPSGKATVVEAPNGFHLLYISQKTQAVKKVLAAVIQIPVEPSTETVKAVYTQANQLLGACQGKTAALDSSAKKSGFRVRQASVTEMDNSLPGVNQAREVVRWAFNKDSKAGNIADQVFEMENRYVIAGLRSINEDDYMSLQRAMEMPQVENMVKQDKKSKQMIEQMNSASDINQLAQSLNLRIDTVMGISMASYPMIGNSYEPKVVGTLCGLEKGNLSAPIKGNMGVYRAIVDGNNHIETPESQIRQIAGQLQMQFMQNASNTVVTALEKAANIEDNRGFYF